MTDKLIVLADLGRVKAFHVTYAMMNSKPQLDLVYDCEFPEAHIRLVDRVSDLAGQFPVGGTSGASNGENHNLRGETERRLIRLVAEKVNELAHGQRHWFLAAGEGINARILDHLEPGVRSSLLKNIAADLVKVPKPEIMQHFVNAA